MADDNQLVAEIRTEFGKGAARRIRAAHKIPAVLYGHGTEPRHLTLPGHEVALAIRKKNALIDLQIEGTRQLALVKDVQKDPVRQIIEHVDLVIVRRGERVTVDVPVHYEGETAPGTITNLEEQTITIEAEATHIPENVVVDLTDAQAGTHVTAAEIPLPTGATLVSDPGTLVITITTAPVAEPPEPEAEEAGGAGGAGGPEPTAENE